MPIGAARPIVASAIANAFADLDATEQRARLERELNELNAIGIQLSAERNLDVLLETILTKAREITRSDAGSLYLVEESADGPPRLRFAAGPERQSVDIPFRAVSLPLDHKSVAGYVALTGDIVNLADAYRPPVGSPFQINRWFDDNAGYRTKSMLVVPMRTPQGETIGALQLINCKSDFADAAREPGRDRADRAAPSTPATSGWPARSRRRRRWPSPTGGCTRASVELFEGFVKASVTAIESRDPTTFGHSFRVADLTVGLAEIVDRCDTGQYRSLRFTAEELRELRYAALLHDFGKVGVREHVLVKSKKLYPAELERIRHRFELLMRDLELGATQPQARLDRAAWRRGLRRPQATRMDAELNAALAELNDALDRHPHDERAQRAARRTSPASSCASPPAPGTTTAGGGAR